MIFSNWWIRRSKPEISDRPAGLERLLGEADDNLVATLHFGTTEKTTSPLRQPPYVTGEHLVISELADARHAPDGFWFAIDGDQDRGYFLPAGLQCGFIFRRRPRFRLKGDFDQFAVLIPVEAQGMGESADFFCGMENSVESGPPEEGVCEFGADYAAGLEFLGHRVAMVPEHERVKHRIRIRVLQSGGRGALICRLASLVGTNPCLIVLMKLVDREGDILEVFEADCDLIARDAHQLSFKSPSLICIRPCSEVRGNGKKRRKG